MNKSNVFSPKAVTNWQSQSLVCQLLAHHFSRSSSRSIGSESYWLEKMIGRGWELQHFNVDYTQSGALSASVEIRRGSQSVPCSVKRVKPGLLMCSFSNLTARLFPPHVHVVMCSYPNGGPLPVRCYRQQDDSYWVEFTPEQTGTHTIEVTFGDVPVAGSPFRCEVVDPKKVKVKGLSDGLHLRHVTTINVDRRQAGDGDLTVEICDPTGTPLKVETLKSPSGEDRITFLPNQTGPHKVNVKVAGFQIPVYFKGYPQTDSVSEQPQPSV
ncbi:Filamin/ABP280 repeat protein [Cooperia oncophora]